MQIFILLLLFCFFLWTKKRFGVIVTTVRLQICPSLLRQYTVFVFMLYRTIQIARKLKTELDNLVERILWHPTIMEICYASLLFFFVSFCLAMAVFVFFFECEVHCRIKCYFYFQLQHSSQRCKHSLFIGCIYNSFRAQQPHSIIETNLMLIDRDYLQSLREEKKDERKKNY